MNTLVVVNTTVDGFDSTLVMKRVVSNELCGTNDDEGCNDDNVDDGSTSDDTINDLVDEVDCIVEELT